MNLKNKQLQKIIGIIVFILGLWLIFSGCAPHKAACPTYYSNAKAKQFKKKSTFEAWTSDYCKVKKKKHKKNKY